MEYSLEVFVPNHLQFLVNEYDFEIAESKADEFVFRSRHCRIYISLDRRGFDISISVSPTYKISWVGLDLVICYLLKLPIEENISIVEKPGGVTISKAINGQLKQFAELLKKYIPQITPLFRESVFQQIEPDFKELGQQRYEHLMKTARDRKVWGHRAKIIKE